MANQFVSVCSATSLGTPARVAGGNQIVCYLPDGSTGRLYSVESYLLPDSGGSLIWWLPPIPMSDIYLILGAMASVLAIAYVFKVAYRML